MASSIQHPSNSNAQQRAEESILRKAAKQFGVQSLKRLRVDLPDGSHTVIDGFADGQRPLLVEVYAHVGPLKGSQPDKLLADALKLVVVRQLNYPKARLVLALGDAAARDSLLRGWRAQALTSLGVEVLLAPHSAARRRELENQQHVQRR